jgi:hypothetical protein
MALEGRHVAWTNDLDLIGLAYLVHFTLLKWYIL